MKIQAENSAPNASAKPPVMLRNGVSSRSDPGKRSAIGWPVAGSILYGSASGTVNVRTTARMLAAPIPTATKAGQRSFWK